MEPPDSGLNPTSQPQEPPLQAAAQVPPSNSPSTLSTSASTSTSSLAQTSPNPNPNPGPNPIYQNQSQSPNAKASPALPSQSSHQLPSLSSSPQTARPPSTLSRPWQPSNFSHFSSPSPSVSSGPPATLSSPASSSFSPSPPAQRGGIAIGVPAHHPSPVPQPVPFSSPYGQHFGGLGRGGVSAPEPASSSSSSQLRSPVQGIQGVGMFGSSTSQMRPSGITAHQQQKPAQSTLRPPSTPSNQPSTSQSFQGHGLLRASSVGSPSSLLPGTSPNMQSTQPWLSSSSQGKPPLPPPSHKPSVNSPSIPVRSITPPQQHHIPPSSQQQPASLAPIQQSPHSVQQQSHSLPQSSYSLQQQEHFGQQFQSPSRGSQVQPHQQPVSRTLGSGNQKSSPAAISQPNTPPQPTVQTRPVESDESGNKILSKRSIHELVNQIGPSEKLDPDVEDILVDLADEFVDSITAFGCSLAKHRKSTTLEAKDILLHLERNWNMTLPGFAGDEIKIYRKPPTNDIHKERLAVIKRSIAASELANSRNPAGQTAGNTKAGLAKNPANILGSPN